MAAVMASGWGIMTCEFAMAFRRNRLLIQQGPPPQSSSSTMCVFFGSSELQVFADISGIITRIEAQDGRRQGAKGGEE